MNDGPNLLVEWSSPWREFRSAIGPAFGRSPSPLAGEAPTGLFPLRGILVSWGAEAILLALAIILPTKLALLNPYHPPPPHTHDILYYRGIELPQTEDLGGAEAGRSGRAGGTQGHHPTQTIRVAREHAPTDKVVDAPNLRLKMTMDPVQNLLAITHVPGPPPAEGVRPSAPPALSKNAIVAPPPEIIRQMDRAIPGLNSAVVPPPANVSADRRRDVMGLSTLIIAPAPAEIPREKGRAVIAMTSPIIQPSPDDVRREPPPLRGPTSAASIVVPPPVSAPVRESSQPGKLSLPAPAVIAPPPSQVTSDRAVSGVAIADPKVVPPPVQLGGRSQDKHAVVGVTGVNAVVPPPPSVTGGTTMEGGGRGHSQRPGGFGTVLSAENVVPPPPSISSTGAGGGTSRARGSLGGAPGASAVVPPPPNLGGTSGGVSGRGSGTKGNGLGGPLDSGSVLAPPSSGGANGGGKGIIVSNQPGSGEGIPANGRPGSIAMSPSGGDKAGLGGSGGGTSIGRGNGPGSGLSGEGSGGAKAGTGHGSDPNSHGGISPYPGTGGAGSGTGGQPPAPGVSIQGGSTAAIINLPSFGSEGSDPSVPGRSPTGGRHRALTVTTKGTSRTGGAFNLYGRLPGVVYTTFLSISGFGTVPMQFSDPLSVDHTYSEELASPEVLQANLPVQLNGARIMLEGKMNLSGHLHDFHQLFADPGAPVTKVIAAVSSWKFTPAVRGNQPVEVSVLLGFNIDTR